MNELVFLDKGKIFTSTLIVSEQFEKRHSDVLRRIERFSDHDFTERNFALSKYRDESGRYNTFYAMTRDGFSMLVMGFTGEKAFKFKKDFIDAFNAMEATIKSLPQQTDRLDRLEKMVENLIQLTTTVLSQPKVIEQKQDYYSIMAFCNFTKTHITFSEAIKKGKMASQLSKELDKEIRKIPDERYGYVNSYPIDILEKVFNL